MTTPESLVPARACTALAELLRAPFPASQTVCVDGRDRAEASASLNIGEWRAHVHLLSVAFAAHSLQRIALCLDDPFDMSCALFAAWAAGKTPVVLPNTLAKTRVDLAFAYDLAIDAEMFGSIAKTGAYTDTPASLPALSSTCKLVIYTSGSTGEPKAITKTLMQLDDEVQTLHRHWGARLQGALVVASVPCHHIYGLWFRVLWPLAAGVPFARHTFAEPAQAQPWRSWPAVVWVAGPAQLTRWPKLFGEGLWADAPRVTFSSGGPLPAEAAQQYSNTLPAITSDDHAAPVARTPIEVFGSTETGGIAWRQQDITPRWTPLDDTDIRIDAEGGLEIRSPRVNDGQWWRTDDGAAIHADGSFALTGRLDRIVKIEGKRLALPSVEAALTRHAWVNDATALVIAGRPAVAVVLSKSGRLAWKTQSLKVVRETLRSTLAETFDSTVLPRRWRFLAELPVNERGKRTTADVAACFAPASPWLPSILGVRPSDGEAVTAPHSPPYSVVIALRVPVDLAHFKGHFPGLPLLPGVVLIDWASRFAFEHARRDSVQLAWVNHTPLSLQQVKFSAPVLPGTLLELTLTYDASRHRVQYRYDGTQATAATGYLAYATPLALAAEVSQ
ncbi:AMP-binding protein [Pandoraea sp. ISTKB]|uniref:AMP-binding protein n=1 Tax=Pandoraea sp. ISTKB TaxID=1586708 RepID=UPI000846F615|nr:AMP-binding protein [Pandoraea sp. ISTKB]ODP32540.1 hypothetical protein A9762_22565 [Pandoraea sp. ISTKB]